MKKIYFVFLLPLLFIFACANENTNTDQSEDSTIEQSNEVVENEWNAFSVKEGGYNFTLNIPTENIIQGKMEVIYHEDMGELELLAGETFDVLILEDQSQMEMVKNEIADHPFYKVEMVVENDSSLLYRFYQEEGGVDRWHIYAEKNVNNATLLIRSNEAMEFSEYEAKKMLESVLSISKP